jgi:hypothetical protein
MLENEGDAFQFHLKRETLMPNHTKAISQTVTSPEAASLN